MPNAEYEREVIVAHLVEAHPEMATPLTPDQLPWDIFSDNVLKSMHLDAHSGDERAARIDR